MRRSCALLVLVLLLSLATIATVTALARARAQIAADTREITAILLLFLAFAVVYRRSLRARRVAEQLAAENAQLAAANREEARTDALTLLRNRRALIDDLELELALADDQRPLMITRFDLDGFTHYNDTFGHPSGDRLLARLGQRLQAAVIGTGTAYRIGGDEFGLLTRLDSEAAGSLVERAAEALSDFGYGFRIGCSHGWAWMPHEAATPAEALGLADERLSEHKAGRFTATRQSTGVLLQVLSERNTELREHLDGVARLATRVAELLGLPLDEVKRIALGAELHDVGKTAIPDAILNKPGPLDDEEWSFMHQHTLIGERIVLADPSLAPTAELVRASHEAFDGTGYPDALRAEAIPLGARIIAVCDAFDAMISDRSYRSAMTTADAVVELRRCAGTQFDPLIIEVFCALVVDSNATVPAAREYAPAA